MKLSNTVKALLLSAVLGLFSFTAANFSIDRNQIILDIVMSGLNNAHYAPKNIDDSFSEAFFDMYVKKLDYTKKFLTQADVNQLSQYKKQVDDEINNGSFQLFELGNELITRRIDEKEGWYKEILSRPFDYSVDETYETDYEKTKFAATDAQLKAEWVRYLKYQTLYRLNELMETQDTLRKEDEFNKKLPFDSLEASARKKVMKQTDDYFKRLKKYNKKQRFADYMNTITAMYDPHTEFFPPVEKKKFDQSMSGQLEGIGARLQQKDDYIKITEIVVGSPSWKQGDLKAGDIILKVAQGNKEPVDIGGMDIDDAIELIKGKKGTEVRLTVKKADGSMKVITLIRDVIQLDETFAHSAILNNGKQKVGYIKLPSFYSDFTRNGAHRCAQDVKKEVEKLKGEGVDGIIIDLRDNGGGSLPEVVTMGGLFVPKGPMVQVKKKSGAIEQLNDDDNGNQIYDGPMVVMVNRNSASASEILAAALQDYKRAVIVGSQSFGKGTVQSFLDLDNYLLPQFDTIKPLGSVKVTMQKFYRINGGTTQLRGVIPDIELPDPYSQIETGEKELDNPMPWDEISKAQYSEFNTINYAKLKKNSEDRVKKSKSFQLIEQEAIEIKEKKDDSKYNLSLEKYRAEVKELKAQNKKYDELKNEVKGFDAALLKMDIDAMQNDTIKLAREKNWIRNIKKDIYLHEASMIVSDMK